MPAPETPALLAAAPAPRKRRPWWLFAPHAVLAVLALATCVGWLVARQKLASALDGAQAQAARAGFQARLGPRTIDGFPFRLRVRWRGVRIAARSGWAVEAPALEAQAYLYAPLHWVAVASQGLTVTRPQGGPIGVEGQALRASASGVTAPVWRIALVGEGVRFTTPAGSRPFSLASAAKVEAYTRPGERPDEAALFLGLTGARATESSVLRTFAADAPVDLASEGVLTRLDAFRGADWGAAVRAWAGAGGALTLGHLAAHADTVRIAAQGGRLAVGADGELAGAALLKLDRDPPSRDTPATDLPLTIGHGRASLGPVPLGPTPRVG